MFISDSFFDKYARFVSTQYMITYMLILRKKKCDFSVTQICDELNIVSKTLFRALDFWKEQGELKYYKTSDDIVKIYISKTSEAPKDVNLTEAVRMLKEDEQFKSIAKLAKEIFPDMKDVEISSVAYIYKKFSRDMVKLLLNYAQDHNAKHPSYMITIAEKWESNGIRTASEAELWINGKYGFYKKWHERYGEQNTPLSAKEIEMYDSWKEKYKEEDILEAIDKTIVYKGTMALNYTDKILSNNKTS